MELHSVTLEFTRTKEPTNPYAFEFSSQEYVLRNEGGRPGTFSIAWGPDLLGDLVEIRQPDRDPNVVQRLGEILNESLRTAGWRELAQIIARAQAERFVVVTIRSNAAELYTLPWELMTLESGQHLGELPRVLLRYEWPGAPLPEKRRHLRHNRVLFAWSAAGGSVPFAEHKNAITQAAREGSVRFDSDADVLNNASLEGLADALETAERVQRPFTIMHLLCHGSRCGAGFGLDLDGQTPGDRVTVDAGRIRQILSPYFVTLRLVTLAACDSGNVGTPGTQLGSVAQALHRAGALAIVASRYPLSTAGSHKLARALYEALLIDRLPLELAFVRTRQHLATDASSLDWASLQLYTQEVSTQFSDDIVADFADEVSEELGAEVVKDSEEESDPLTQLSSAPADPARHLKARHLKALQRLAFGIALVALIGLAVNSVGVGAEGQPTPAEATKALEFDDALIEQTKPPEPMIREPVQVEACRIRIKGSPTISSGLVVLDDGEVFKAEVKGNLLSFHCPAGGDRTVTVIVNFEDGTVRHWSHVKTSPAVAPILEHDTSVAGVPDELVGKIPGLQVMEDAGGGAETNGPESDTATGARPKKDGREGQLDENEEPGQTIVPMTSELQLAAGDWKSVNVKISTRHYTLEPFVNVTVTSGAHTVYVRKSDADEWMEVGQIDVEAGKTYKVVLNTTLGLTISPI